MEIIYIIQIHHHLSISLSFSLLSHLLPGFLRMDLRFNFVERCNGAKTCQDRDLVLQPKGQIQFTRQAKFKTRTKQTHWDCISKITACKTERVSYNRPLLQLRPWLTSKGTGTRESPCTKQKRLKNPPNILHKDVYFCTNTRHNKKYHMATMTDLKAKLQKTRVFFFCVAILYDTSIFRANAVFYTMLKISFVLELQHINI